MEKTNILSSEKRRTQLIKGAVVLFKDKGFHRTTTGEIAESAGLSTGTLYEFIKTKEEVLFLVCDSIYERVQEQISPLLENKSPGLDSLEAAMRVYFQLMDDMQDEVVVMYQELKSLPKEARSYVLKKEKEMIEILENVILTNTARNLPENEVMLIANNIFIQGQMWGFRRWMLQKEFSIQTYTDVQIKYLMNGLKTELNANSKQGNN